MGGPIVTSYDLNMLQLFYYCNSCRDLGLELKYLSNQQLANPRVCSDAWNSWNASSPLATTPIVAYTSTINATFVLQFRATNTNVTDVKPPPPPFLSSNVYKHIHIDVYKHDHYFM
ncbi:hypothetical protein WR25_10549 [Diploscapter pachys]|uniref:Uncharacterized protein n=1 Tax=Diploscapter pachys TaxID=2018661 RepID=A0A2A2J2W7_9BILA|nr:hypothetical protein WR25_10549 [Diploscapter pachys]